MAKAIIKIPNVPMTKEQKAKALRKLEMSVKYDMFTTFDDGSSIVVEGKIYESKRYTYDELKNMFNGKVVFVENATMQGLYPIDGILINVCETKDKDDIAYKYLIEGRNVEKIDFSTMPLFSFYQGIS